MSVVLVLDAGDAEAVARPGDAACIATWAARLTAARGGRLEILIVRPPDEGESARGPQRLVVPEATGDGAAKPTARGPKQDGSDGSDDASGTDETRSPRADFVTAIHDAATAAFTRIRPGDGRAQPFDLLELVAPKAEVAALGEIESRTPRLVVLGLPDADPPKFARFLLDRIEADVVGVIPGTVGPGDPAAPADGGSFVVPMPGGTGGPAIELADTLARRAAAGGRHPVRAIVDHAARARCRRTTERIRGRFGRTARDRLIVDVAKGELMDRMKPLAEMDPAPVLVGSVPSRGDLMALRRLRSAAERPADDATPGGDGDGDRAPVRPTLLLLRPAGRWAPTLSMRISGRLRGLLPALEREERLDLNDRLERGGRLGIDFIILIVISTLLAGLGILRDSPAVVIGAMVVAPLMTPLVAAGLALAQANVQLFRRALVATMAGIGCALAASFLLGIVAGGGPPTAELVARGEPAPIDLAIAGFSGIAGAWAVARPDILGALVGVAIAVALVPPIAATGIALAAGPTWIAGGSAVLFLTNLVAIVLGAAGVFRLVGVRPTASGIGPGWVRATLLALGLAAVILLGPLVDSIDRARPDLVRSGVRSAVRDAGGDLVGVLAPARSHETGSEAVWTVLVIAPLGRERLVADAARAAAHRLTGAASVSVRVVAPDATEPPLPR